nr:metal ABC transporter permease [Anaerolineae bacterium]
AHCLRDCDSVTITPDDPRAETRRECTNCRTENLNPRDPAAVFAAVCSNCGTYTPAEAWQAGYTDRQPLLVFFPKSLTVMGVLALLALLFVLVLYKELQLTTFDPALAQSLGFFPGRLTLLLMVLVSLVAVGAFNAVGSVLVVAFFIIPPAAAYLLTDKLWRMLLLAPLIGAAGAYTGYDLSRGDFLGLVQLSEVLRALDGLIGLNGYTDWNVSISASMVLMLFVFFVLAWLFSPRYGLLATLLRRIAQRRHFLAMMLLGHLANHEDTPAAAAENAVATLPEHLHWPPAKLAPVLARLRAQRLVQVEQGRVLLTERGRQALHAFRQTLALER